MHTENSLFWERLRGGLIVSCQALESEPLFGSEIMAKVALSAAQGGAVGIRANTPSDIKAIKQLVPQLPVFGLWKVVVPGFEDVYITPRVRECIAVAEAGAEVIALDATLRPHPEGTMQDLIRAAKSATGCYILADIDSEEAALAAIEAGADAISTTLSGYTPTSPQMTGPDLDLVRRLALRKLPVPLFAEGRIHTPEDARAALDAGAFGVIVGGAITRPRQITERFIAGLK
jgi:N-acylglucosamine-6-phosphate 2-epimerase